QVPAQLADIIDDAYIQWPHIYMGRQPTRRTARRRRAAGKTAPRASMTLAGVAPMPGVSATAPKAGGFCLNIPDGVAGLLNVSQVHKAGTTGKGVRVAMVDTGFAHSHPYFVSKGY